MAENIRLNAAMLHAVGKRRQKRGFNILPLSWTSDCKPSWNYCIIEMNFHGHSQTIVTDSVKGLGQVVVENKSVSVLDIFLVTDWQQKPCVRSLNLSGIHIGFLEGAPHQGAYVVRWLRRIPGSILPEICMSRLVSLFHAASRTVGTCSNTSAKRKINPSCFFCAF